MSVDEITLFKELLPSLGFGALAITVMVILIVRAYFLPYLNEKAKNLATREDVAGLTHAVETIRVQYATLLEAQKARHQLRLAGIDRRLQVHQEAFVHWRDLFRSMHTPEVNATAGKCSEWWERNCLYLEPTVREAFATALVAANSHASLLQDRSNVDLVKKNWAEIMVFPKVLFDAIQLPGLSENEFKALNADADNAHARGA